MSKKGACCVLAGILKHASCRFSLKAHTTTSVEAISHSDVDVFVIFFSFLAISSILFNYKRVLPKEFNQGTDMFLLESITYKLSTPIHICILICYVEQ